MESSKPQRLNPSIEDIENLAKERMADSVQKITPRQDQDSNLPQLTLKEKASTFEPDPIPYKLISGKHVINKNLLSQEGEIYVRRISSLEEAYIDQMYKADELVTQDLINKVLEGCVKSRIQIGDLPILEKIPLFFFILSISYGSKLNMAPIQDCKSCGQDTVVEVDYVEDFETKYFEDGIAYPKQVRLKTYDDFDLMAKIIVPYIRNQNTLLSPVKETSDLVAKIRTTIHDITGINKRTDEEISSKNWFDILAYLDEDDKKAIQEQVNNITENYGKQFKTRIKNCSGNECPCIGREVSFRIDDIMIAFLIRNQRIV